MLSKIKENHIDSIADVSEQKTVSLDMKKPTNNVDKEIKQFDIANYIALQRQPGDFEIYTFLCNIWKPNADLVFQKLCVVPRSFPVVKNGSKNMNGLYIDQY